MARECPLSETTSPSGLWDTGRRIIDLTGRPCIMGILNVTPDSFSDGSLYCDVDRAVDRAFEMEAQGADIIDIGGESTRPFAPPVPADEELDRVMPVIERLDGRLRIPLSIDTYKAVVARETLRAGVEIVNDISAMTFDPEMAAVVAAAGAGVVLMHTRGNPEEMQRRTVYDDLVAEVAGFLADALDRARGAGIAKERVVLDPGIGFGKSVAGNLELVRRLGEIVALGRPVLVGPSRKSFIGKVLGRETGERLFGTAAAVAISLANGASVFRVHDVQAMRDVVDMAAALTGPGGAWG